MDTLFIDGLANTLYYYLNRKTNEAAIRSMNILYSPITLTS